MKKHHWMRSYTTVLLAGAFLAGCAETSEAPVLDAPAAGAELPAGHPDISGAVPQQLGPASGPVGGPVGVVMETMESGGYTYALLEVEGDQIWAAGPVTPVEVGDSIALLGAMGMQNFTSSTLDRTFEEILFVGEFRAPSAMPAPQAAAPQGAAPQGASPQSSGTFAGNRGDVAETMNSGGYTYVRVEIEGVSMWIAGPQIQVEVGQTVGWMDGMFMPNFHSSSLDRTFEAIYFANQLTVVN